MKAHDKTADTEATVASIPPNNHSKDKVSALVMISVPKYSQFNIYGRKPSFLREFTSYSIEIHDLEQGGVEC